MKNKNTIIETAKQTIVAESNAIANLVNYLNNDFENAQELIVNAMKVEPENKEFANHFHVIETRKRNEN